MEISACSGAGVNTAFETLANMIVKGKTKEELINKDIKIGVERELIKENVKKDDKNKKKKCCY